MLRKTKEQILFKPVVSGGAAAGALTAAYLVGSISMGGVFAQTTPTPSPTTIATPSATATTATQTGEQADTASEASEAAALASQAKITADQARAAALAKYPGATVGATIQLDHENGVVAYSVHLTDTAGTRQDVSVDATSGTVLAAQADDTEAPGAPEGPETGD